MECGCECVLDDYEVASICDVVDRRARKEHQCTECQRTIRVGEQYELCDMLFDGRWSHFKTCAQCQAIRRDYGCGVLGMLREEVWDCLGVDIVTGDLKEDE